jgi:hypothetical protein
MFFYSLGVQLWVLEKGPAETASSKSKKSKSKNFPCIFLCLSGFFCHFAVALKRIQEKEDTITLCCHIAKFTQLTVLDVPAATESGSVIDRPCEKVFLESSVGGTNFSHDPLYPMKVH